MREQFLVRDRPEEVLQVRIHNPLSARFPRARRQAENERYHTRERTAGLVQTAAAPSTAAMRPYSPHHPAVEPVEELSEMGFSVVVASRENPGAESFWGPKARALLQTDLLSRRSDSADPRGLPHAEF